MAEHKARILVMDDDTAILELVEQVLTPSYDVKTTDEWLDGTNLLMADHFDLLILDLGMPVFSAPEFLKRVHSLSVHSRIPVLVISAFPHLRERLDGLPVAAILAKPFAIQDLVTTVDELVNDTKQGKPANSSA